MLLVPTFRYLWSRDAFNRMRFSREKRPDRKNANSPAEQNVTISVNKHHTDATENLQRLKRSHHLERRPFL